MPVDCVELSCGSEDYPGCDVHEHDSLHHVRHSFRLDGWRWAFSGSGRGFICSWGRCPCSPGIICPCWICLCDPRFICYWQCSPCLICPRIPCGISASRRRPIICSCRWSYSNPIDSCYSGHGTARSKPFRSCHQRHLHLHVFWPK